MSQNLLKVNGGSGSTSAMVFGANSGSAVSKVGRTKIIKRYQNRKLYDTQQSCYVTLDDIAKMIRTNEDVMVIDNKTKNDITAATLTQIIFESEKKASHYAPLVTLREIIQHGNGSISHYLAKLGAFTMEFQEAVGANFSLALSNAEVRPSSDDLKLSLEERVASAATQANAKTGFSDEFDDGTLPELPNNNQNLIR